MSLAAVILKYDEPGWTERTYECAKAAGIKRIIFADRHGVGNMSRAFNDAIFNPDGSIKNVFSIYTHIWWLTNVEFTPDTAGQLLAAFDNDPDNDTAAVHPCHPSDHRHLQSAIQPAVVPFIELTAPMFSTKALRRVGPMDDDMPYWGMDLDWSHRAKSAGYKLMVSPARVGHEYLRHVKNKSAITEVRERMRVIWHSHTEAALIRKYGVDWHTKIWPK